MSNEPRYPSNVNRGRRPVATGAALAALLAFVLAAPSAWTAIARPAATTGSAWQGASSAADCRAAHEARATATARAPVTTDEQFLQWALAAHREAVGPSSFTTLAAARALTQERGAP